MKLFLLAALAILGLAHAEEVAEPELEHEYIYFPDGEGVPQLIDLKEEAESLDDDPTRNVDSITFNLFTRNNRNNGQQLIFNNVNSVHSSFWIRTRPTRFVTHGWRSSQWSQTCQGIRDAYLAVGDYNVIVIDWSNIAGSNYNTAAGQVRNVAARVSQFINFMNWNAGLNVQTTMLVGHSLGGHVVGIAARGAGGRIQAVVSLDPALPLFGNAGAGSGIHRDDADHVQVIHTNSGLLGLARAAGDSDFYPNGGRIQPGCGADASGACAHSRAYLFFAESIRNPTGFRAHAMRSEDPSDVEERSNVFMGGRFLSTHARGSFHLNTHANPPFAMG